MNLLSLHVAHLGLSLNRRRLLKGTIGATERQEQVGWGKRSRFSTAGTSLPCGSPRLRGMRFEARRRRRRSFRSESPYPATSGEAPLALQAARTPPLRDARISAVGWNAGRSKRVPKKVRGIKFVPRACLTMLHTSAFRFRLRTISLSLVIWKTQLCVPK